MRVVQKISMDMLLSKYNVEYFGKIDENTFFVVYRPEQDGYYDTFRVSIGPPDDIKEMKVRNVLRYRSGTLVINTVVGTFSFSFPYHKDKRSLFCSWPIELF